MIDIDYLKQLLEIFDESSVNDLRLDKEGTSIRLTKNPKKEEGAPAAYHYMAPPPVAAQQPAAPVAAAPAATAAAPPPAPASAEETAPAEAASSSSDEDLYYVTSPIVGTFYQSPSPDADPFVTAGSSIKEGTVLCIVEAMKLMNEIESDVKGTVKEVLVEDGQPVEWGTKLFSIELSSN